MLLEKLIAARIGDRPVVFVTHRLKYLIKNEREKTEEFLF